MINNTFRKKISQLKEAKVVKNPLPYEKTFNSIEERYLYLRILLYPEGSGCHFTTFFRTLATGFCTFLTMLIIMFGTFSTTFITDLSANATNFCCLITTQAHELGSSIAN
jgi:hypothetical protein